MLEINLQLKYNIFKYSQLGLTFTAGITLTATFRAGLPLFYLTTLVKNNSGVINLQTLNPCTDIIKYELGKSNSS